MRRSSAVAIFSISQRRDVLAQDSQFGNLFTLKHNFAIALCASVWLKNNSFMPKIVFCDLFLAVVYLDRKSSIVGILDLVNFNLRSVHPES
jgi:hypothetical protein